MLSPEWQYQRISFFAGIILSDFHLFVQLKPSNGVCQKFVEVFLCMLEFCSTFLHIYRCLECSGRELYDFLVLVVMSGDSSCNSFIALRLIFTVPLIDAVFTFLLPRSD